MTVRIPRGHFNWAEPATVTLFVVACLLLGGSSRPFALTALVLRPIAVLCLTVLALRIRCDQLAVVKMPLVLLGAFAATIAVQLVPLPSSIWASLQSRAPYEAALASLGLGGRAHPLSFSPDRTWNSLVALVVPMTMLVGYAAVGPRLRAALLPGLIIGALASAVLAIAQLSSGPDSTLYFYVTSDHPPGFFANRNHQAAFLAIIFPALRAWTLQSPILAQSKLDRLDRTRRPFSGTGPRALAALAIGIFLIPMIFVTGSRAGFALMLIGLAAAWAIAPTRLFQPRSIKERWTMLIALAAASLVLGATIASGRIFALQRIINSQDLGSDLRAAYFPTMLKLVQRFWLFGTGFGTFDPVLRGSEPDALLSGDYFNNAHNDLIELVMNGGVASTLVLVAFLLWWGRLSLTAFATSGTGTVYRARAAAAMIAMLLIASLLDYPLRTPLLSALLALLSAWLGERTEPGEDCQLP